MNILIDTIRISGFRGIQDFEMSLPRVAVLIGPNNSGKTSVIKALQLAIGDYSRYVSAEDFHIDTSGKKVDEILIDIRIVSTDAEGNRIQRFSDEWAAELKSIQAEPGGNQFYALRTRVKENMVKGGYDCTHYSLSAWPVKDQWKTAQMRETKIYGRLESLPFIGIDAQRDLHSELKEKTSFAGKILSAIQYNEADTIKIEGLIDSLNTEAVSRSSELESLKTHLSNLDTSFGGSGKTEITPFSKKVRDISKNFTINYGTGQRTFPMEYHGMGTRSWASMLTVKSFVELTSARYAGESKPFFPIIAAEEPEAHLHPNAQKTIYKQLSELKGQVIISTHSPSLVAVADTYCLRSMYISNHGCEAKQLSHLEDEDLRKLKREVINTRGDIIFSKAIVLCEGETEEQALPLLFQKIFSNNSYEINISFVGVGGSGKKYKPFLTLARDFFIPVFILSDGEVKARKELKKVWSEIFGVDIDLDSNPHISVLDDTDFEGYLLRTGFGNIIEDAIIETEDVSFIESWITMKDKTSSGRTKTSNPPCSACNQDIYQDVFRDYVSVNGRARAILDIIDCGKTKYAPAIANELCKLDVDKLPPKIIEFFDKLNGGLSHA